MTSNVTWIRPRGNAIPKSDISKRIGRAKAEQIARAIALLAQLPDGNALVPILGDGTERSNLAALSSWVQRTYPAVATLSPTDQVTALATRLHTHFEEWRGQSFG